MSIAARLTTIPRAFDPDLGAEAAGCVPDLTGDLTRLVSGAGGSSPYLKGLIAREAAWLPGALDDPEAALAAEMAGLQDLTGAELGPALRQAKRRVALLTGLADLAGVWSLETVMQALTDFADLACERALRSELDNLVRRGKLPEPARDDSAGAAGLVILAMGKMGAGELNYSSDIDLICLFDETLYNEDDILEARSALVRATRSLSTLLSDRTADGYVFRTDLRLRPDPAVTPVCLSMGAAEQYYESFGRTWERAAMIKARPAAGDLKAGRSFLSAIRPFIWRRHLDFTAIEDAHAIRLRIRDSKGLHGKLAVPGHDMKLGKGGIREIEFFTQTRQLIAGGRDPALRLRGTQAALGALARKGWIPGDVSDRLQNHYRAYRTIEHRIQMVHDAQTHKVPTSSDGLDRVACLMDRDRADLLSDIAERLREVSALTEDFFAPDAAPPPPRPAHEFDKSVLARWSQYPAFRSHRAVEIFDRFRPELLRRLSDAARPDEALLALDGFLSGLPAGVQLFSLFDANPDLIDLLIDVVGTSPALGSYLARNSGVFDAVIGGDFFARWPGNDVLIAELRDIVAREDDYERRLDAARRWKKEWHFRVGVHHLRGLIDADAAGRHYAGIADAVITALWPVVIDEFAGRHGPPPGRGAAILGMGSVGAERMNAQSDLDLIVIYDAAGVESSEGRRPLNARAYYARLTQALITAMTAPMAEGRLYEIDMRLRPSGKQGPVATSWPSYQRYQREEAWLWEHLALTRARVITGPADLVQEIEDLRAGILCEGAPLAEVCKGVAEMRARLAAARSPVGLLDIRNGPGRLQDIELLGQAGIVLSDRTGREVPDGLGGAREAGWLSAEEAGTLTGAYHLLWSLYAAARLLTGDRLGDDAPGAAGAAFLCRAAQVDTPDALRDRLVTLYAEVADVIDAALERGLPDDTAERPV